jgi:HAD superfamily hydrolase (TIGR01509 family)
MVASYLLNLGAAPQTLPKLPLVMFDVMDTLVVDPFFTGMHKSVFGCDSLQDLFREKDPSAFLDFESGAISEAECYERYFLDRRPVDAERVRAHLRTSYKWIEGMRELCDDLQRLGVPMALCSNYPRPHAELIEEVLGLSRYAEWAAVSGVTGHRKPAAEAYKTALAAVGRAAEDVVFVDDSQANVDGARAVGMEAIHFEGAGALRAVLRERFFPELPAAGGGAP